MKSNLDIEEVLRAINVPASAWRVYKNILKEESVSPAAISKTLNMPRTSVYDQLRYLKSKGLIVEKDIDNKSFYSVAPLEEIEVILKDIIKSKQEILKEFSIARQNIKLTDKSQARIRFFETKESIERYIQNILFTKSKIIYSLWPYEEMLSMISVKKLNDINSERISRGIKLKVLWPHKNNKKTINVWESDDRLVEKKFLSKDKKFEMGYIICDDKVIFISSESEGYAFVVESQQFSALQRMQFDSLWLHAK